MDNLSEIIAESKSKNSAAIKYYGYYNKRVGDKINDFIIKNELDISHWKPKSYYCVYCGSKLKKKGKFCNSSCAAKYNNSGRKLSNSTKHKIGDSLRMRPSKELKRKCVSCGNYFTVWRSNCGVFSRSKTCSDECSSKLKSMNATKQMKKRIENGTHKGWSSRDVISYPEKFFINVLNNNGIMYSHNHPIKQRLLGLDNNYSYFMDFYINELNIDLEIDGQQHERRGEHDKIRDKLLTNYGINVYRIKWKNINTDNGKLYIRNEINNFLKYCDDIKTGRE